MVSIARSSHGRDLKTPGSGLITSQRTFVTGPRCSKGNWKILNHCEKLEFDGPRGGNQYYYRAGDEICNNRQKHGDKKKSGKKNHQCLSSDVL